MLITKKILLLMVSGLLTLSVHGWASSLFKPIRSDALSYRAEFRLPEFRLEPVAEDPAAGLKIRVSGLVPSGTPGRPALPAAGILLGVPHRSEPRVVIHSMETEEVSGVLVAPVPLTSYPVPAPGSGESAHLSRAEDWESASVQAETSYRRDPGVYGSDRFYPPESIRVTDRGIMRDLDFVRVEVTPFSYNPATKVLRCIRRIDFSVLYADEGAPASVSTTGLRTPQHLSRDRSAPGFGPRQRALPAGAGAEVQSDPRDPLETMALANGSAAQSFRFRRTGADLGLPAIPQPLWPPPTQCYKIEVVEDGLYRLSYSYLQSHGVDMSSVDPRKIRIYDRGREVAIRVIGESDGSFDPGDSIEFYGMRNRERWTDTEVYWMTLDEGPGGLRMAEVSRFPDNASSFRSASTYKADARIEEQQWHWRTLPFPEGKDSWFYEDRLFSNSAIQDESSFVFSLAAIAPTTAGTSYHIGGSLVSWLGDTVETSQNVVIYLNGVQVANLTWDTSSNPDYTIDVTFSTALLRVGDNTLKLVQPKPAGTKVRSLCVDYLDVEYPAFLESAADTIDFSGKWTTGAMFYVKGFSSPYVNILRITDPAAPEILTAYMPITTGPGAPVTIAFAQQESSSEQRFLVLERNVSLTPHDLYLDTPSALADPNNSADYVIITHSAFFNAIQTLAAYRQSPAGGNHTVAVVRLEDVYDEFSYGNVDSQAIRDFIAYAFSYWGTGPAPGPQPLYVLLVGDTSEDYKNYWNFQKPGYDPPSYLPAREHYQNNPMWTRAPSDNWFACVAGDDIMPDLLIGRLPARDPAALAAVLAKIATYEAIPPGDPVNRRVAMLTDDNIFNTLTGCPPYVPVGELGEVSAGVFENGIVATYFPTANPANLLKLYAELYANSDEVRAAMAAAINGGVSFFTYYGHGAVTQLGQHCGDVAGSGKTFFNILDTPLLQNNAYPTVGLSCSCNVGDFEMIRDYTAGPLAGVFATQSLAEKLVMENGRGMVAFVTSTSETGIAEASADVQGAFDALYNPATIYLPPFNPDPRILGSVVYGVRMRLLEVFGMGDPPPYPVGTARDPIATLAILGDPALQMNMEAP